MRGNHRGVWRPQIFLLVALCLLVTGCDQTTTQAASRTTTPTVVPRASYTPRPTPFPNAQRNAALGCAPTAPRPYPQIVSDGQAPDAHGKAPNEVALTFDDGPTSTTTPPFLDYLERTHIAATFFVVGNQAHYWPDIIKREWRDGFAIGVHTWDHANMTQLTVSHMRSELSSTLATLHATLGADACLWLWRPPYGAVNQQVVQVAASFGLTTINWDDSGLDWTRPGTQAIATMVLNDIHPGSIVLLHDGPALREQTLAALPIIIAGLKERGLIPVTLPKLLADGGYPGIRISTP